MKVGAFLYVRKFVKVYYCKTVYASLGKFYFTTYIVIFQYFSMEKIYLFFDL